MRYARALFAAVILLGCSEQAGPLLPTGLPPDAPAPPIQSTTKTFLWGMVIENSGGCIDGATVAVIAGQGLGRTAAQQTPCGAWDYDGGFQFTDLTAGVQMTLRVSAPGYAVKDTTLIPALGPQMAHLIMPTKE
jgi:hypothetical protein